ncbi:hypothetical protein ASZ90_020267 [hydrocarbon metagenome]|uniref:Uncharacterized protein n=1 Tax=hydrocarbon metagenome TaxID=938273 RepID=A0A0W8E171_9ZZZZ
MMYKVCFTNPFGIYGIKSKTVQGKTVNVINISIKVWLNIADS